MGRGFLGEFELLVTLAVLRCGEDAYGVPIGDEIRERTGRPVSRGALYVTLGRLVEKGYLESELRRGEDGRERRYYAVLAEGLTAIQTSREAVANMVRGVEGLLET